MGSDGLGGAWAKADGRAWSWAQGALLIGGQCPGMLAPLSLGGWKLLVAGVEMPEQTWHAEEEAVRDPHCVGPEPHRLHPKMVRAPQRRAWRHGSTT